ncbi:MAG TPA: nuclear transport factor 2 family protein [Verrucomicrobiae bacterium]|nr:nuclear transport factor 2 family protein [Verrucomicrobiae bacterium]
MKSLLSGMFVAGMMYVALVVLGGLAPTIGLPLNLPQSAGKSPERPGDSQDVMTADHALVMALAKTDNAAAEKMFDEEFVWTNSDGETVTRAKVLKSWPKPPLGDESGAQVSERSYGQVGAVQVASGKVHILRIWVKRPAGWRLLDYHEVTQRSGAAPPPGPGTNDCENPCKGVPYTPKDDAEKGILKSWGELETAVTNHDPKGWSPHFLDEFVLIASGGADPVTKAGRLEQLSKPGFGPAPPQLAANPEVRFIHFGDSVVMIAQANPYSGKPAHISRVWVYREGMWRMAFSYQTTIQSAAPIVPPKS